MTEVAENKSIKIYSFYYKKTEVPIADNIYIPVMAGNNLKQLDKVFTGDDSGQSISEKNDYYSELTGLYWVWKNTNQDIVGSCHYRRYFTAKKYPFQHLIKRLILSKTWLYKKQNGIIYTKNIKKNRNRILSENEIKKIMLDFDAILPKRRIFKYSIKEHFRKYHDLSDLKIIEEIIVSQCPEYLIAFNTTLDNNWLYANNMFILNQTNFNELMKWLFEILFEFEKRVDLNNYKNYQKRIFGFIGERLITVWFNYNKLKINELPIIYFKKMKFS